MEIIDLDDRYEQLYCACLEDWAEEMQDAGDIKQKWLVEKKKQGLRVKLAREGEKIVGMIHYLPIEHAPAIGKDLYYIYCIWVHGHRQGVGNHQGKGIGSLLLAAAEEDSRSLGAKGMAAWGIILPFFMRSRWFKRHGYRKADSDGMLELVWKPFSEGALPPRLFRKKRTPETHDGKVTVTCLKNGWCPAQNCAVERMKRIAAENADEVLYVEVDTEERRNLEGWGLCDAVFIDRKPVRTGPPPSYEQLKKLVLKKIAALKRRESGKA